MNVRKEKKIATADRRANRCRTKRNSANTRSRKEFLLQVAGITAVSSALRAHPGAGGPKVLVVVTHPDDEYAFAATVYRITHELGGSADQVVITNGEAGYRYSKLAEAYYGVQLTREDAGRLQLPRIRKEEARRAGRIIGIRNHYFLDQKDARFTLDGDEAFSGIWNVDSVRKQISDICLRERYDFLLTLLPTTDTHGHHQAAALIALEAIAALPPTARPVVLGSEPSAGDVVSGVTLRSDRHPCKLALNARVHSVDRLQSFGPGESLNYNIIVNWVIAEHKSQGLFQTECGKHTHEDFWVFETGTPDAASRTEALFARFGSRRQAA